jgi:hypothetical protein
MRAKVKKAHAEKGAAVIQRNNQTAATTIAHINLHYFT